MGIVERLRSKASPEVPLTIDGEKVLVRCRRGTPAELADIGGDPIGSALNAVMSSAMAAQQTKDPRVVQKRIESIDLLKMEGTLREMVWKAPVELRDIDGKEEWEAIDEAAARNLDSGDVVVLGLFVLKSFGLDLLGGDAGSAVRTFLGGPEGG